MKPTPLHTLGHRVEKETQNTSGTALVEVVHGANAASNLTAGATVFGVQVADTLSWQLSGNRGMFFMDESGMPPTRTTAPGTRTDVILAAFGNMQTVAFQYTPFACFTMTDAKCKSQTTTLTQEVTARYMGTAGNPPRPANGNAANVMAANLAGTVTANTLPVKASRVWDLVLFNHANWSICNFLNNAVGAGTMLMAALPDEFIPSENELNLNTLNNRAGPVCAGQEFVLEMLVGEEDLADTLRILLKGNANMWVCTENDSAGNPLTLFNNGSPVPTLPVTVMAPGIQQAQYVERNFVMAGPGNRGGYGIPGQGAAAGAAAFGMVAGGIAVPALDEALLVRAYTVIARAVHDKEGLQSAQMLRSGLMAAVPASQGGLGGAGGAYADHIHRRNAFVTSGQILRPSGSLSRSLLQRLRNHTVLDDGWTRLISMSVRYFQDISNAVVGCLMVGRMFSQARREMGVTGSVLCPNSPNTATAGGGAVPAAGYRKLAYESTCSGDAGGIAPSPLMACMRIAGKVLFDVDVPQELLFISPGDDDVGAYDKMEQAQLYPGRVPCGMSLWWFPAGLVKGDCIGLPGVYSRPNDTVKLLREEQHLVLTGSQVRTVGTSGSVAGQAVGEAPDLAGGPGMLGHGVALLRMANTAVDHFTIAGVTVGQNVPAGGGVGIGGLARMYSARTAVGPAAAIAAASTHYICADELFTDFDPAQGVDLQMIVDNASAIIITQALQGDFIASGTRFIMIAVSKMVVNLARNAAPAKRRKVMFVMPAATSHQQPAVSAAGPSSSNGSTPP